MAAEKTLMAPFPWGLLVVSDEASDRKVEDDRAKTVLCSIDVFVVRVLHEQDGETTVRVWFDAIDESTSATMLLGQCTIHVPTGRLILGDVMKDITTELQVEPGRYDVTISGDSNDWPQEVNLLFSRVGEKFHGGAAA